MSICLAILLTGCLIKPDVEYVDRPVIIAPPSYLLENCAIYYPQYRDIQTVLQTQTRNVEHCVSQIVLIRDWVEERRTQIQKQQED